MENDRTTRDQAADALREDERSTAAVWLAHRPMPVWYFVAGGLWFAAITWVITSDDWRANLALVPLVVLVGVFSAWRRRRGGGVSPMWNGAPRELNPALWGFIVGAVITAVSAMAVDHFVGRWPAVALVGVAVTVGLAWHEWAYARGAAAARERLR